MHSRVGEKVYALKYREALLSLPVFIYYFELAQRKTRRSFFVQVYKKRERNAAVFIVVDLLVVSFVRSIRLMSVLRIAIRKE